jgi:hypothetical protein
MGKKKLLRTRAKAKKCQIDQIKKKEKERKEANRKKK